MKPNYTLLAILCMGLCVPFVYYLANRNVETPTVRIATFNLALHRKAPGELLAELRGGESKPARQLAEIIQRQQIDVILLNELDRDEAGAAAEVFAREYLAVPQNGADAIDFAFSYCGAVNTGEPSGKDLDGDSKIEGPQDAFGYGAFPGQYGLAVLSRYPILKDRVRTFQKLKWSAMPNALRPEGYYSDDVWQHLRLSSKSHWDVPIGIGSVKDGFVLHALCSHPTPPSFDGVEDRNGCRNHDEIRFWVDYLTNAPASYKDSWIVDDAGAKGGLAAQERFVVMGDLNCDPADGDSRRDAIQALIGHPRVQDAEPRSLGGVEQKMKQFGTNMSHLGDPGLDTGDFDDTVGKGPGNLRVDYVLPAKSLKVVGAGVNWPKSHEPSLRLAEVSDHRLVWIEFEVL
jgi:endonuclease/exonuclease/phosphatase family metal-dependent hydrolase